MVRNLTRHTLTDFNWLNGLIVMRISPERPRACDCPQGYRMCPRLRAGDVTFLASFRFLICSLEATVSTVGDTGVITPSRDNERLS